MDPQPHPLFHLFVRMKPTSTNVFLQVAKNVEVTRGKILAVRKMSKCFPAKPLKLIPLQTGSMGTGVIVQKDACFRPTLSRVAAPSATKKRTTPLCSSFLASFSNNGLTHFTLHAHLQSNRETTVWSCAFSVCLSPTLHMAVSIRNNSVASLCKECFFFMAAVRSSIDCPLSFKYNLHYIKDLFQ